MSTQTFTAIIHRENGGYVANSPEAGITSKGATIEEALANLKDATRRILNNASIAYVDGPLLTTYGFENPLSQNQLAQRDDDQDEIESATSSIPMTGAAILASPLWGLWKDRTDIGDSVEYARHLRKRAETRNRD